MWSALLLAMTVSHAEPERQPGWTVQHPVALGVRGGLAQGGYQAPGFGGHLKIRPHARLGVEAFADTFARTESLTWKHDHVLGFHLYSPVLRTERFELSPTIGACTDLRATHSRNGGPSVTDVWFGVHGGAMAEWFTVGGWSLESTATAFAYLGNETAIDGWTATSSNQLHLRPVGQLMVAMSYAL